MKKIYIVANWKSNKNEAETREWLSYFKSNMSSFQSNQKEIILCPSFTLLSLTASFVKENRLPLKIGAQDISPFDKGAYTGEVNGEQIKEYGECVLVGHSERRKNFSEDNELVDKKVDMAKNAGLCSFFFIQDKGTAISKSANHIVYEPPSSISPGPSDTPQNAEDIGVFVEKKYGFQNILYGGNVTSFNVFSFVSMPHINGVLVGRASLNPREFIEIIQHV